MRLGEESTLVAMEELEFGANRLEAPFTERLGSNATEDIEKDSELLSPTGSINTKDSKVAVSTSWFSSRTAQPSYAGDDFVYPEILVNPLESPSSLARSDERHVIVGNSPDASSAGSTSSQSGRSASMGSVSPPHAASTENNEVIHLKAQEPYYVFIRYYILYDSGLSPPWPPRDFLPLLTEAQFVALGTDICREMFIREPEQDNTSQMDSTDIKKYEANPHTRVQMMSTIPLHRLDELLIVFLGELKRRCDADKSNGYLASWISPLSEWLALEKVLHRCFPSDYHYHRFLQAAKGTGIELKSMKSVALLISELPNRSDPSEHPHAPTRQRPMSEATLDDTLPQTSTEFLGVRYSVSSFDSRRTKASSDGTFMTAKSSIISGSFHTASARTSLLSGKRLSILSRKSAHMSLLQSSGLLPVNPFEEQDWSGRGQHAEFDQAERYILQRILTPQSVLGTTQDALVESVRCKRILLARKTIRCRHRMKRETAIEEVKNMQKLKHSHIVQVIGTYVMGNDFSILMYPVADYDLEDFMQSMLMRPVRDCLGEHYTWMTDVDKEETKLRMQSLAGSFRCLTNALKYIHANYVKHMDIKPKNILVRDVRGCKFSHTSAFKVYIADFGIARSYRSQADTETEGPTSFTRRYAAPEVADQAKRGLPADVFSLGCVFAEILAVLAPRDPENQRERLESILQPDEGGRKSYQANISSVQEWLSALSADESCWFPVEMITPTIATMISFSPDERPSIEELATSLGVSQGCCSDTVEPEPFEAAEGIPDFPDPPRWTPMKSIERVLRSRS